MHMKDFLTKNMIFQKVYQELLKILLFLDILLIHLIRKFLKNVLNWLTKNITKVDLYLHILMKQLNVQ